MALRFSCVCLLSAAVLAAADNSAQRRAAQLVFSRYVNGSIAESASAIGHDAQGFIYIAGTTASTDFPIAGDAVQTTKKGNTDIFLVKIDPHVAPENQIAYGTYLGGTNAETLNDMYVSPDGTVYLTGQTFSSDFPKANASQSTLVGTSDAFIVILKPTLPATDALLYSSYIGGGADDSGNAIALDPTGRVVVVGETASADFPMYGDGAQTNSGGGHDGWLAIVDPANPTTFAYTTYIGGSGWDAANALAVAKDGMVWVTGLTYSSDLTLQGFSYDNIYQPGGDAFLVGINPRGGKGALVYGTYLGGSDLDEGTGVAVLPDGRVAVTGYTFATDFPVTPNAFQRGSGGDADAFVAVFDLRAGVAPQQQLTYSTYLGGSRPDAIYDVQADAAGKLYVTGFTISDDFPVIRETALQSGNRAGGFSGFVSVIDPAQAGSASLVSSTFLASTGSQVGAGLDLWSTGEVYVTGYTTGPLFDSIGGVGRGATQGERIAYILGFLP